MTNGSRTAALVGAAVLAIASAGCGFNQPHISTERAEATKTATPPPTLSQTSTPSSTPSPSNAPPKSTDTLLPTPATATAQTPTEDTAFDALAIAAGGNHTCALIGVIGENVGLIQCWGKNDFGQLGDGTTTDSNKPVNMYWGAAAGYFTAVTTGWSHTCAIGNFVDEPPGGVICWGYNKNGELGDGGNRNSYDNPTQGNTWGIEGAIALAAGDDHACAVLGDGSVQCWGYNAYGQLGDGTTDTRNQPVPASFLVSGVVAVAAGWGHTCALVQDGGVRCWGNNQFGQLGDGSDVPYSTVRRVVGGAGNDVTAVTAGGGHTCVLKGNQQAMCWGQNNYGQLGDGTTTSRNRPVRVDLPVTGGETIVGLAAGGDHTCALTNLHRVFCWGGNSSGQLGDGTNFTRTLPVAIDTGGQAIIALSAGRAHTCGITSDGGALCWGDNEFGQLGNGTNTDSAVPTKVIKLGEIDI